ncbi:ATP-dependent helicase, partial [bacterium]|nr:ATP-dependent helicase [bacterium]
IARAIRALGHTVDEIHSNRTQSQRQKALKGFADGTYRALVATDIAARGIDVEDIELVINYDLPTQIEDYVHRIGRTGRAGRSGKAISFASPEQKSDVAQIQQLINITLPIKSHTGKTLEPIQKSVSDDRTKKSGPGRRRGNSRNRKRKPGEAASGSGRRYGRSRNQKRSSGRRKK